MKYTKLSNTDINISRVCLGCMGFGEAQAGTHTWTLSYEESEEIIKYALDKGINFFDTAMAYSAGTSEEFLGRALNKYAKREDVVIATKFSNRTQEDLNNNVSISEHINACVNNSLKRLNTDYIDLYIYHVWDNNSPITEVLKALHELVIAKKVKAIGVSNCFAWQLAQANEIAKNNGWTPFSSIQGHHNLLFREEEREMIPYCKKENIALTPYSSLASGRLSRRPHETSKRLQEDTYAKSKYDATAENDNMIIERVMEVADKNNISMTNVSIAWLLTKVTSPVIGATKKHHIDGAVESVNIVLSDEDIKYLEEPYVPHKLVGAILSNK